MRAHCLQAPTQRACRWTKQARVEPTSRSPRQQCRCCCAVLQGVNILGTNRMQGTTGITPASRSCIFHDGGHTGPLLLAYPGRNQAPAAGITAWPCAIHAHKARCLVNSSQTLSSRKRGQRTRSQLLRKGKKLDKAMERVEKVGVRVDGEKKRKISKLTLKHMY